MKQTVRSILYTLGIIGVVSIWLWIVESYTVGSFDQLQICKVYHLTPEDNPDCISTEDFQEYGCCFSLMELTKECCDGTDIYTAVFRETGSLIMK